MVFEAGVVATLFPPPALSILSTNLNQEQNLFYSSIKEILQTFFQNLFFTMNIIVQVYYDVLRGCCSVAINDKLINIRSIYFASIQDYLCLIIVVSNVVLRAPACRSS